MSETKTYREIQAERDARAEAYWESRFDEFSDDPEATENLAFAYGADN
jgi:hypothetical protein